MTRPQPKPKKAVKKTMKPVSRRKPKGKG